MSNVSPEIQSAELSNNGSDNGVSAAPKKWQSIYEFSNELEPIITALNNLFRKYEIVFVDDFISFPIKKNKVTPFIYPPAFPNGLSSEYVSNGTIQ